MNTLKPIDFIIPNPILFLTEWKTQEIAENEFVFSMEHLYLLINWILQYLYKPGYPECLINEDFLHKPYEIIDDNKLEIIDHFALVLTVALSFLFIAFFIPIFWVLSWCFCCRNQSKRSTTKRSHSSNYHYPSSSASSSSSHHLRPQSSHQSYSGNENLLQNRSTSSHHHRTRRRHRYEVEKSCDFCIRPILSFVLLSLLVFSFLFIVCSFVTNNFVHDGVKDLPKAVNNSLADFEIYLNNTQYELNILFKTNFAQLESQIQKNLNTSGDIVKNKLEIISQASSIDNLTMIVSNLQPILHDLRKLINHTNELKFLTVQLRSKISRTKQDLEDFFKTCRHHICIDLEEKYYQIRHLTVSSNIGSMPNLNPIVDKIQYLLKENIIGEIQRGKEKLNFISKDIQSAIDLIVPNIRSNIAQANKALNENVDLISYILAEPIHYIRLMQTFSSKSNSYVQVYSEEYHYAGLVCTTILLIILLSYLFGLLSGVCGDQPTRYNYRQRSKRSDCFSYFGMTIFFLTFTVLFSLSTIFFLFGGFNDRTLCLHLKNMSNPQSDRIISLLQTEIKNQLTTSIDNEAEDGIDSDPNGIKSILKVFSYLDKFNLVEIIDRCHQNQSLFNVLRISLNENIRFTKKSKSHDLNLSDVVVFKEDNLTKNAERIELKSHFNGRNLRETVKILMQQARDAQNFINLKGRHEIRAILRNFIDDLTLLLDQYSSHVEQRIKNEVGRCLPLSRAYNHTVSSLCDDVIVPFTACWFSVTVTLLVFIPSTLLISILMDLFKRVKRSSTKRESVVDKRSNRRPVLPSAPIVPFGENHSEEETWSPGAIPQHLYTRPPPYNF
ncbi:prominin protein-like protein [Sarcoptes scabiei]|uniref:Prominin protein-like protein n=1 Tax=Sarcoptes scabiei TaxID=52283 RepID=A0A131ZW11_SARSC|nr:prominin protein-like protein [Sarcoptes scabiei]